MTRTPAKLPDLTFKTDAVPATTAAPNPFAGKVTELAANWDDKKNTSAEAAVFTIPNDDLNRMKSRIQDAAKAINKSARVTNTAPDKAGNTTVTFWLRNAAARKTDGPVAEPTGK